MMVVYCQEKESEITLEFDTFVFFFLEKTKKNARMSIEQKYLTKAILVKVFLQSFGNNHVFSSSLFLLFWDECLID